MSACANSSRADIDVAKPSLAVKRTVAAGAIAASSAASGTARYVMARA